MDAFRIACGFANISPGYFWRVMDLAEFEAIGLAYRESWEKTRRIVTALGVEMPLPWDNENIPKYNSSQRLNIASQLSGLEKLNKIKLN